jgi:hypothetical protein
MTINFIPNDPAAGPAAPTMRAQAKRPTRPASRSGFIYSHTHREAAAIPGTPTFLFWQAREAAIAAVQAWEASAGAHKLWQGNRRKLPLLQDVGIDLNAYYDRASFSFFHEQIGTRTFFSGASTDVVAHELGHGLLDSARPDFFDVNYLEVGAFHEAFGDVMAMLTALSDLETRQKLLAAAPDLRKRNFVEGTAEELSRAIGLVAPGHNASEPRHGFNNFAYQLPTTLPGNGGPGALINEVHSFGQIFTGCFWDLLANLFAAQAQHDEAALLAAARLAGKIAIAGAKAAVVTPRFMQSVGRAMTLADQSLNAGANREHIRAAFARHNILLGTNAVMAPSSVLDGEAPTRGALGDATRRDLMRRMGAVRGARLDLTAAKMGGMDVVHAVQTRAVSLTGLDPKLKGVVAMAQEPATVGRSGTRAAVMGALPNAADTDREVQAFVASLLAHDRIRLDKPKARRGAMAAAARPEHVTHAIQTVGGKKVLQRLCFMCSCHGRPGWLAQGAPA